MSLEKKAEGGLESSLVAVEEESYIVKLVDPSFHSKWIYRYLSLILIVFLLFVFFMFFFPFQTEEPVFVSLHEKNSKSKVQVQKENLKTEQTLVLSGKDENITPSTQPEAHSSESIEIKNESLSELNLEKVEVLDSQQQYVELSNYLHSFEATYPQNWTVLFYLGKANVKMQKFALAESYFKKITTHWENYKVDQVGQTYFELGKIAIVEKNYEEGIHYLNEASKRNPGNIDINYNLASAYFKNEDFELAIDIYQKMLAKDPNDQKIRASLGMANFELGQFKSAEKNLHQALDHGSNDPMLFYYLGKVESENGNHSKAIEFLQKSLELDPKLTQASQMLKKIYSTNSTGNNN